MIKEINIGGKPVKFEATTGTGELYQIFTGRNIYEDFQSLSRKFTPQQIRELAKLNDKENGEEYNKALVNVVSGVDMNAITESLALVQKMGFVMYIQANTAGETPLDRIRKIKERLNGDEFLAWLLEYDNDAFNDGNFFNQLMALMGLNSKTHVQPKN